MIVYFAYSNEKEHEYDLKKAVQDTSKIVKFSLEAKCLPVQSIGKGFTADLLDGQKWQLPMKRRKKQTIITEPNLHLSSYFLTTGADKGKWKTLKTLLEEWYYARTRWINTGALLGIGTNDIKTEGLVKVVRSADELSFELHENVNFLESVQITIETAGAY
jgi:hypothetical protein